MFNSLKILVDKITSAHENYATNYSKNETVKSDSIKRKERIKNIDIELENWKNLKVNSQKMINDLQERKKKVNNEMKENKKKPRNHRYNKGPKYTEFRKHKKRSEELTEELDFAEERFNKINNNINSVQEKLATLERKQARNEATLEGIATRKKDLFFSINAELNISDEIKLLSLSELNVEELPTIDNQIAAVEKIKKERESMGTVNPRADIETKKFEDEIKKMEDDRADLYSAIIKLKSSIEELNQKEERDF